MEGSHPRSPVSNNDERKTPTYGPSGEAGSSVTEVGRVSRGRSPLGSEPHGRIRTAEQGTHTRDSSPFAHFPKPMSIIETSFIPVGFAITLQKTFQRQLPRQEPSAGKEPAVGQPLTFSGTFHAAFFSSFLNLQDLLLSPGERFNYWYFQWCMFTTGTVKAIRTRTERAESCHGDHEP